MRYPDDVGLVWASMARVYSGTAAELSGIARALICFPVLTDHPAFPTPWAIRIACDWYDTHIPASRDRIKTLVAEENIKVVLYMGCPGETVDFRFLHRLGIRTVDYEQDSYPTTYHQPWVKRATKRILRRWLKRGIHDRYVANAQHQRRFLIDFAQLPRERVDIVVNGVDVVRFEPKTCPDPATLGLPLADHYVVSISQARPEKRVDLLIDAAVELFRTRPELSLTFVHVGDGQCLDEWKRKALGLGLGNRYQFVGRQTDVAPYHQLATLFAHPAERESFGYAVAEAMACGKPVIAARSPGPAEIIDEGVTGRLVEPGDIHGFAQAMLALIDDPLLRAQMGAAGRERAVRLYDGRRQSSELANVIRGQLLHL